MAVHDLIFRQKNIPLTAMNAKTMLAHFLSFVTPERMHKTRFSSLLAATQSLLQHQRCTVTAIGGALTAIPAKNTASNGQTGC
ncbi:hypothetical protein QWY20_18295 [Alkalimonas sp. MEB108]|uniref:Uncharacterized protein n=1 Tax=Alkalimonas cellulosilytica TaxID=3058395 RepID=A0ABU7JA30_9GAMM|nr:hypothetical protein [Alkalimonas sp. MEB108]MEE2003400.1 hypothetical protein [Alkalimonas sp. MEB108]